MKIALAFSAALVCVVGMVVLKTGTSQELEREIAKSSSESQRSALEQEADATPDRERTQRVLVYEVEGSAHVDQVVADGVSQGSLPALEARFELRVAREPGVAPGASLLRIRMSTEDPRLRDRGSMQALCNVSSTGMITDLVIQAPEASADLLRATVYACFAWPSDPAVAESRAPVLRDEVGEYVPGYELVGRALNRSKQSYINTPEVHILACKAACTYDEDGIAKVLSEDQRELVLEESQVRTTTRIRMQRLGVQEAVLDWDASIGTGPLSRQASPRADGPSPRELLAELAVQAEADLQSRATWEAWMALSESLKADPDAARAMTASILLGEPANEQLRDLVITALGRAGSQECLAQLLDPRASIGIQMAALVSTHQLLGMDADLSPELVTAVTNAADGTSEEVSSSAHLAAGTLLADAKGPELERLEALIGRAPSHVRLDAALNAGEPERIIREARGLMTHQDETLRAAAFEALGKQPGDHLAELRLAASDPSDRVRACAAKVLREPAELKRLCVDPIPSVRMEALQRSAELGDLGPVTSAAAFDENEGVRNFAKHLLQ